MLEVSICQSILKTIEHEMKDDALTNILQIHLKVGVLSCIEAEVLQQVFTFMKIDTSFQNANLFIELVDVNAVCENCGNSFKVEHIN